MLIPGVLAVLQAAVLPAESMAPRPIRQLIHSRWTVQDGAPGSIISIAQTTDGYLWLAGKPGLTRFDGVRFVPFRPQEGDSLPTAPAWHLTASRDGGLWILWDDGTVSRLREGRLRRYGASEGLVGVRRVAESSTGVAVAATYRGLFRFEAGKWIAANDEWGFPSGPVLIAWFDRDDGLWAQTGSRLLYLPKGGDRFITPASPFDYSESVNAFAQERDGAVWVAELYRSAHTVPQGERTAPDTEVQVGAWGVLVDRRGALWVASLGDGLRRVLDPARIRGTRVPQFGTAAEHFTAKDGLLSDVVYALAEDREGNIWVGSGRGLECFREGAFSPVVTPGSIRPRVVYATRDGTVWTTASSVPGITRLTAAGMETVGDAGGRQVINLFEDSNGGVWTTWLKEIARFRDGRFTRVITAQPRISELQDIVVDDQGGIWVAAEKEGLLKVEHDSLVVVGTLAPSTTSRSRLYRDRQGRFWIAQGNRVIRYEGERITLFRVAEGKLPGAVYNFFEDRTGTFWTLGEGGMSRLDGGGFRPLAGRQAVPAQAIYAIAEDLAGAAWLATDAGVFRLPPGEIQRAIADSGYAVRYQQFGFYDGVPGTITAGMNSSTIVRGADGRIWVAGDSGIASIDPERAVAEPTPPARIEALRAHDRELPLGRSLALPPHPGELEIDYTAMTLAAPERIHFRYQLLGEDDAWREVGTRRRAYFTGLGPGHYTFRVAAGTPGGTWSDAVATLDFRVLPAWYQTWWFKLLVAVAALGGSALLTVQLQRRKHRRAQDALRAKYEGSLAERARIAQDLHDTLMQGFAGVTLQLKSVELSLVDRPDATRQLGRIHELARESLREARERVWEMRDSALGADGLAAALERVARDRIGAAPIRLSMTVEGAARRLPAAIEDAAFRIGREAIANAVQHGDPRHLGIVVRFAERVLQVEVRDDGRGFTPAEGEEARRHGHFGVSGMHDRAAGAGGRCTIQPSPTGGTTVSLVLPLAQS